ncbi:MAG: molybdenum cofactor biosynthesis protein MoaE [Phycisphaerales bacterium]|nr:molybdenum cofactor biosynthesis protein MoaE [Phycisphaerales bacterium]
MDLGGGPSVGVSLTREPLDLAELSRAVAVDGVGAIATFVGVVRPDVRSGEATLAALDYTAHEDMAIKQMRRVCEETCRLVGAKAIRLVHRVGKLRVGEVSLAVVVSAAHRAEAFDACRIVTERLKVDVPIFKRDVWSDGEENWVNGLDSA